MDAQFLLKLAEIVINKLNSHNLSSAFERIHNYRAVYMARRKGLLVWAKIMFWT